DRDGQGDAVRDAGGRVGADRGDTVSGYVPAGGLPDAGAVRGDGRGGGPVRRADGHGAEFSAVPVAPQARRTSEGCRKTLADASGLFGYGFVVVGAALATRSRMARISWMSTNQLTFSSEESPEHTPTSSPPSFTSGPPLSPELI